MRITMTPLRKRRWLGGEQCPPQFLQAWLHIRDNLTVTATAYCSQYSLKQVTHCRRRGDDRALAIELGCKQ